MYGWIWRKLPGGWALKSLESVVLILVIGVTLVVVVFPWVEPKLPFSGNTVSGDSDTGGPSATTAPSTPAAQSPSSTSTAVPTPDQTDVLPGD